MNWRIITYQIINININEVFLKKEITEIGERCKAFPIQQF